MNHFPQNSGIIFDWGLFRRDVRRDLRNCVLFLFFFYAVNFLSTFIAEAIWMMSSPAFLEKLSDSLFTDMLSGDASALDLQALLEAAPDDQGIMVGLMSIIGMVAGGCVFFIYRKRRFFTDLALPAAEPLTLKILIMLVVITQGLQGVYGLITTLIDALLPNGLSLSDSYSSVMDNLYTPFGLLYVVLIGPIFEELIFRGAVMGALRRFGNNFAILFSSLLFGFYHMLIMQIPFAFAVGLLLGYVATRWSLRTAVLLHIIVNGLSMLLTNAASTVITTVGGLALIACAILTLVWAIRRRAQLRARISQGAAYYPHTYANGFSSVAFWIFVVVMTGGGILQMNFM